MLKDVFQVGKATFASVALILIYSLVFAGLITLFSIPVAAIKPTNQVFKIVAVVVGGLIFIRGQRGLLKGIALGISVAFQAWMLFSAIALSFAPGWNFVLECVICAFAGGITGVIAVNLRG